MCAGTWGWVQMTCNAGAAERRRRAVHGCRLLKLSGVLQRRRRLRGGSTSLDHNNANRNNSNSNNNNNDNYNDHNDHDKDKDKDYSDGVVELW